MPERKEKARISKASSVAVLRWDKNNPGLFSANFEFYDIPLHRDCRHGKNTNILHIIYGQFVVMFLKWVVKFLTGV